jgi:phage baseplate assembly protein W
MPFYRDVNSITPTDRPDVVDSKSVIQSILNILRTKTGEIPFIPDFGLDLESKLFDLMTPGIELDILTEVFDAIETYEPRVDLQTGASSVELFEEENRIELNLVFTILGFSDDEKLFTITESFAG